MVLFRKRSTELVDQALRAMLPHARHERLTHTDPLLVTSIENWARVPVDQRQKALEHLGKRLPLGIKQLWDNQYQRGVVIGSHNPRFHFEEGMSVRNLAREILSDDKLPGVQYPNLAEPVHNWDDFYMGALYELCSKRRVMGD